jgi:hypothetical protein
MFAKNFGFNTPPVRTDFEAAGTIGTWTVPRGRAWVVTFLYGACPQQTPFLGLNAETIFFRQITRPL